MSNDDIICNASPTNECILKGSDKSVHARFKPINHKFGNNFVNYIAKANRPKLRQNFRKINFRNESKVSLIKRFEQGT